MNNKKKKKCIAFDMDTKQLKEYYDDDNWRNAYNDIGAFLHKYGFIREQGSVYDSTYAMDRNELSNIIDSLCKKLKWFGYCVKSIRGYDQPEIIDFTEQAQEFISQERFMLTPKKAKTAAQNQQISPKLPTKPAIKKSHRR